MHFLPPAAPLEAGFLAAICDQLSYMNLFGNRAPSHGDAADPESLSQVLRNGRTAICPAEFGRMEARFFYALFSPPSPPR
tara:strand:- start:7081 stop:7320 length:240 start_codon:yes stop_codon:yes gene_type:complete